MATRYVTMYHDWCGHHFDKTITVVTPDDAPIKTGLLDKHGRTLYRLDDREPVGFHRFERSKRAP